MHENNALGGDLYQPQPETQERIVETPSSPEDSPSSESEYSGLDVVEYARFERLTRLVSFATGRCVILVICVLAAWYLLEATAGLDALLAAENLLGMLIVMGIGLANLVTGFISRRLRRPFLRMVESRYDYKYDADSVLTL